jgi:tRNA A22 N-methylase
MSRQEKLREYLASSGFSIIGERYSLDAGKYYVCMLASYTGKCREISPLEAIVGFDGCEYFGREHRLCYLSAKLSSLERAYKGKKESGIECPEELKLIFKLRDYINRI